MKLPEGKEMRPMGFNHFDAEGRAVMVDISGKEPTSRVAVAGATVKMKPETVTMILEGRAAKGDVLSVARLAGIMAAKKTPELIPLSHPLAIQAVSVAALTVYDMCKGTDRGISIGKIALLFKEGGKSGTYREAGPR
jgi:cyclic pyranopterin phosphate synthase